MLKKIIREAREKKSRLHDEKGNFVGFQQTSCQWAKKRSFLEWRASLLDYRPETPWISYSAIEELEIIIDIDVLRILQIGSGM